MRDTKDFVLSSLRALIQEPTAKFLQFRFRGIREIQMHFLRRRQRLTVSRGEEFA